MQFSNSIFYHGTTDLAWSKIKFEKIFRPDPKKEPGDYWTSKGVYFACNNPYIALWYAYFRCYLNNKKGVKSNPIVIKFSGPIPNNADIVNLLTEEGARLVIKMHHNLIKTNEITGSKQNPHNNLDSIALWHIVDAPEVEAACIFSAFQEGNSFQKIIHKHDFRNEYISDRVGFCVGDNMSACFLDTIPINFLGHYKEIDHTELLETDSKQGKQALFPVICQGMNEKLLSSDSFTKKHDPQSFRDYFKEVYHD